MSLPETIQPHGSTTKPNHSAFFMHCLASSVACRKSSLNLLSSALFSSYWAKRLSMAVIVAGFLGCLAMVSICCLSDVQT